MQNWSRYCGQDWYLCLRWGVSSSFQTTKPGSPGLAVELSSLASHFAGLCDSSANIAVSSVSPFGTSCIGPEIITLTKPNICRIRVANWVNFLFIYNEYVVFINVKCLIMCAYVTKQCSKDRND